MRDISISQLRESVIDYNSRSIFINAHPKRSLNKIDIISLFYLTEDFKVEKIIPSLFQNESLKINLKLDLNNLNRNQKKILYLLRRNNDLKNELNINPFALGYPLIEICEKKNKKILSVPLLIWDFEIYGFQNLSGSISISRKSNQEIIINPSLIRLIKKESIPFFKKLKIDENNNQSNLKNVIQSLLKIFGINNSFPEFTNSLYDQFDENSPKFNNSHETKLINNGVFGLYANSKESLISDYVKLDQTNLTCHFDFPKDNNETLFTGVALDHSQQRVIRSINQKKNIVINGPPGTGKSKTLTASIVYLLSKGYSCLVVCEKKTAMDVLYENMESLNLQDFCIPISEVRKDRRKVVNKARSIIENINSESKLFKSESEEKNRFSKSEQDIVKQKIEKVNEIINLINKTKKRLNKDLLGTKKTYSDLVVYVKNNRYKELSDILKLNSKFYNFTFNEHEYLQNLFDLYTKEFKETFNPFKSSYTILNPKIFEKNENEFNKLIRFLYHEYHEKLNNLKNKLDLSLIGKSNFAFKYMNYSEDKDEEIWAIQNEYRFYLNKIKNYNLFHKSVENKINAVDLRQKIILLNSYLKEIFEFKNDFNNLKTFHILFTQKNENEQYLIKKLGFEANFKTDFFEWYYSHILSDNFIDNFDFNGFDKGYHDIELDVNHINSFIVKKTVKKLIDNRIKGISKFKRYSKITIEQFFAKKSTSKRKKYPLFKISNHNSGIFKSFFPVCMTNPGSCASLFPMEKGYFDYVIFDESSQLKIEDTFTSLLRGKKAIVSGDIHQLPPMDYFNENLKSSETFKNINDNNSKSLLDFAISQDYNSQYLDIHYRSKHPDLINFSNAAFYNSRLIPKPPLKKYKPIEFFSIKGRFINQVNTDEANSIVNYIETKIRKTQSLGIATFSLKQRDKVLNELELRSKSSHSFYRKLESLKRNGFFVKNIENIQGEEREIIIIGTTYGLDNKDRFKELLGPINTKKRGHKLLNVLITRAIEKKIVFSSIPENIFSNFKPLIEKNGNRGKSILYAYLYYAKAISDNQTEKISEVLDIVSQKKYHNKYKRELNSKSLKLFSTYFVNNLSNIIGEKIICENYFKVGGYEYEIALKKRNSVKLLIDINGKVAYNNYEDYIFDMDRCHVAKKSNYNYYRLWLSNFYNNLEYETNKIINLLNKEA